jgi:hypothetical protein
MVLSLQYNSPDSGPSGAAQLAALAYHVQYANWSASTRPCELAGDYRWVEKEAILSTVGGV